ncbi:O-antigen ligase family protein [Dyella sp. BiH032]|uniref:O-antigen ligase family protein n=1 Tax=Dyella sp. BiH032 TaxID=3075430 RepID=UPI002892A763|nr:O-antigen ligase family protein [Dyella sp. BiH032]WNL46494.1 O-antigen ligase family protein [Dyella sp. BiH032]
MKSGRPLVPKAVGAPAAPREDALERWLHWLVFAGLAWLIVGLAIMPSGASFNPGRWYQRILALTLYLPTLVLLVRHPRNWLDFWRRPLMPAAVLLLAWGSLSLLWGHADRPADEVARNLSILLFLLGWQQVLEGDRERTRWLLLGCGLAFAVVAIPAIAWGLMYPPSDGRLVGFGVMANANLAAGAMGAALVWLWPWAPEGRGQLALKWGALSVLALFVLLTEARSALGALFCALVGMIVARGGKRAYGYALAVALLGVVGFVVGLPMLMERGWSLRPEIFAQSMSLFLQHPWLGHGQGTPFQLHAGTETLTHAHNLFTQLAIELGTPGVLLWTGLWLALAWRAWRHRREDLAQVVLGLWIFGTVLVQFDLPYLLDSPRPGWLFTWLPLAASMALGRDAPRKETAGL